MTPQSRLDEANTAREAIGWSWMAAQAKLGWSVYHLNQIKTLKRQISDAQITYLKAVAEAVTAIPVPEPEPAMSPENLRVMLLDDIAAKLADEYLAAKASRELSGEEVAGALWAIGQLADRMNVTEEVRTLIHERTRAPHGNVAGGVAGLTSDGVGGVFGGHNLGTSSPWASDRIPMTE